MKYETVFDASRDCHDTPWPWWVQALALVCLMAGLFCMRPAMLSAFPYLKRWDRPRSVSMWLGLIITSICLFQILFDAFGDFANCGLAASALQKGLYSVVQGPVTGFDPHYAGVIEKGESFTVSAKRFLISRYALKDGGFRQVSQVGGPIRNGLNVRISYKGETILRLEVAK